MPLQLKDGNSLCIGVWLFQKNAAGGKGINKEITAKLFHATTF
jgi:hypothetical protein